MTVDEMIDVCASEPPTEEELRAFCQHLGLDRGAALDELSRRVGRAFLDGRIAFERGDSVMNHLFAFCTSAHILPSLTYAVYEAFDAGEYSRGTDPSSSNPPEQYTKPLLKGILNHGNAA